MWSSQKNITNVLNSIFVEQKFELYTDLKNELKKNYENFLKNKVVIFFYIIIVFYKF
jgi:hypothetical protein